MRVKMLRSTRMMVATWECQSVPFSLSMGSKTVTVRLSSRLRPSLWLSTASSGTAVAEISSTFWRSVG
jgi:hypothetical protein